MVEIPKRPQMLARSSVIVDSLIVSENYRQLGAGRALMLAVEDWAKGKGISRIELNVYAFNQAAVAFYQDLGYQVLS